MPHSKPADDWLPAAAAARLLGASVRQLQRREAAGYVEKRVLPRGVLDRSVTVEYFRADIVALKSGKPNTYAREIKEALGRIDAAKETKRQKAVAGLNEQPNEPATVGIILPNGRQNNGNPYELSEITRQAIARISPALAPFEEALQYLHARWNAEPTPAPKPWLTLDEAIAYSGLPRAYLLQAARDGAPFARDVSAGGARARWRFSREGLAK